MNPKYIHNRERPIGRCRDCGEMHPLSHAKLCDECGMGRALAAVHQLNRKRGPVYEKWLAGMQAALERLQQ